MGYYALFLVLLVTAQTSVSQVTVPASTARQAVISGKIMDSDGDPLEEANVELLGEFWHNGKLDHLSTAGLTTSTNDLGQYRLANIRPGRYYLFAQKVSGRDEPSPILKPDIRPLDTFYPRAANLTSATPLIVKAGQELTGLDIVMRSGPTYHIRGKVVSALPTNPMNRYSMTA